MYNVTGGLPISVELVHKAMYADVDCPVYIKIKILYRYHILGLFIFSWAKLVYAVAST